MSAAISSGSLLGIWAFLALLGICLGQAARDSIVTRCTQYKDQVFRKVSTFAPLSYDAPETEIKVDHCQRATPYIVGGTKARAKEYPQAARLGNRRTRAVETSWICGGTLISERFVLTAAHCLYSNAGPVNIVRIGEVDFNSTTDNAQPEDYPVRRNIAHPDYDWDSSSEYNDIALTELARAVIFSEYKLPACLPVENGDELKYFTAVGWGNTRFTGEESPHLLYVGLQRFSSDDCAPYVTQSGLVDKGLNAVSQICAGSSVEKDTCNGDSGGPLFASHPDYRCMLVLVGVTSFGTSGGCGTPGYPAVYTRVNHYLDWINDIVWK